MNADADTTIAALRQAVAEFVDARDWRPFHGPKNLLMSIAIETAELMERFQWLTTEEAQDAVEDPAERAAIADDRVGHFSIVKWVLFQLSRLRRNCSSGSFFDCQMGTFSLDKNTNCRPTSIGTRQTSFEGAFDACTRRGGPSGRGTARARL